MSQITNHDSRSFQTRMHQADGHGDSTGVHIGFDIGSVSFKLVVVDDAGTLLEHSYTRTHGRPVACATDVLTSLLERIPASRIGMVSGTGAAGRLVCRLLDVPFANELVCQAAAVKKLHPDVRTVIEMGGQDSKLIFFEENDDGSRAEFSMNTACAAGTGSFLDQQASRLGVSIEKEFAELALQCTAPPRVAGRCSVFAKSDMIHLQQQATPVSDIIAGLCLGLARNLKSNLGRGKEFVKPVAFCGGVASNGGVVRALEDVLNLQQGELIVPEEHAVTGAYGAILTTLRDAKEDGRTATQHKPFSIEPLHAYLNKHHTVGHRLERLSRPSDGYPESQTFAEQVIAHKQPDQRVPGYLGIDVGSISTNVVVIDEQDRVLAKAYLMTAGRPIEAVRQGLEQVGSVLAEHVDIRGVGTTGSGRYLTGDFVGADIIVNEITAQATAAAIIDPTVDTIFEIGGQDSKYISLENGVVVDFEMNHACAAGTGSFIEEQAERLGINIKEEFANRALSAESPIRLGERCTVFMETDLLSYQQQGATTDNLVAGLSYSIVSNYLNRVVGHRKIGKRVFFQGGTAFNKAVVAAFEKVTGKRITVPSHHEVTGALGVAAIARRHMQTQPADQQSGFRGFELSQLQYEIRSFECDSCSNNCEIKEVMIPGRESLFYGSRCDKYNVKKEKADTSNIPDLFRERQKLLETHARVKAKPTGEGRKSIGIPMALANYQLLPFWGTLVDELGFDPILSGKSTKSLIRKGVESVLAQPCFPVKVAHGHVLDLIDKQVDMILLPSVVSMPAASDQKINNQLCPYVQTIPYQVATAIEPDRRGVPMIKLPVRFREGRTALRKSLQPLTKTLGVTGRQLDAAMDKALQAMDDFEQACRQRGREVLDNLGPDQRALVIIARPYSSCDPGASLDLPTKLRKLGELPVPMDFLDLRGAVNYRFESADGMYWGYGQRILKAADVVRDDPRLYSVYLSNFSCGPDSFVITFFKDKMGSKPALVLEIDEHSADAGVVTRLEAFLESLRNSSGTSVGTVRAESTDAIDCSERTIYIPWMGDHAYALAAAFRACGQPADVLPLADEQALQLGRRYTTGKECLPCIITTGDMLKRIQQEGFDRKKAAFFMPGGSGPCRFGQYNCLHRLILSEVGYGDVPVVSPSQNKNFYEDFKQFNADPTRLAWVGITAIDTLVKALLATRPYERNKGQADRVYEESVYKVCSLLEAHSDDSQIAELMRDIAAEFAAIPCDRSRKKPLIGVVGEIYVRSHTFSNQNLIRQIEACGAEAVLSGFGEWMYYTNVTRMWGAMRTKDIGSALRNRLTDHFQRKIEHKLAKPFENLIHEAYEPSIDHVLELAEPYVHRSFEGETVLSIGKMVELYHIGAGGIVNVGPFTCMPTTIVSSVARKLTQDLNGLPILTITYDGQNDPTTETRLEAFIHQAKAFSEHTANRTVQHA